MPPGPSTRPPDDADRAVGRATRSEASPRGASRADRADRRIARIAGRHGGAIHHDHLVDLGLSRYAISRRVEHGALIPRHRSVYFVGHLALAPFAEQHAALLAMGAGATILTDGAAHALAFGPPPAAPLEVAVAPDRSAGRRTLQVRRLELGRGEVVVRRGLRVTSVERTLMDLVHGTPPDRYARLMQEAFARKLTDARRIRAAVEARGAFRGRASLVALLEMGHGRSSSDAERRLYRLILRARLPRPVLSARFGRWTIDLFWAEIGLAVEVDSFGAHGSPWAQGRDTRKDVELRQAGLTVLRLSAHFVANEPEAALVAVAQAVFEARRTVQSRQRAG